MTAEIIQRLSWTFDNEMYESHGPDVPIREYEEPNSIDAIGTIKTNLENEREFFEALDNSISIDGDPVGHKYLMEITKARIRFLERKLQELTGNGN